jgi:hypothetical protein
MNELNEALAQVCDLADTVNRLRVHGLVIPEELTIALCDVAFTAKLLAEEYEQIPWARMD